MLEDSLLRITTISAVESSVVLPFPVPILCPNSHLHCNICKKLLDLGIGFQCFSLSMVTMWQEKMWTLDKARLRSCCWTWQSLKIPVTQSCVEPLNRNLCWAQCCAQCYPADNCAESISGMSSYHVVAFSLSTFFSPSFSNELLKAEFTSQSYFPCHFHKVPPFSDAEKILPDLKRTNQIFSKEEALSAHWRTAWNRACRCKCVVAVFCQ